MKTSAILLAIRLYKHPQEMQWLCEPEATLPDNITDLLRLSASRKLFEEFVEKNQIKADIFIEVLNNFIEKVLFNEENSLEKQLGLTADANAELRKLHYKLLMKAFHPDRNESATAAENSSKITFNYQTLQDKEKEKERQQSEYKNIVISSRKRTPPRSFYQATHKAEKQLSRTKNIFVSLAAVALIAVVTIGLYVYETDTPQLIIKQDSTVNSSNIVEAPSTSITLAKFSNSENSNIPEHQLEKLLHNLETAYEQGDVKTIKPILENAPDIRNQTDKEISAKLDTLFSITKDRKMLLFDFSWNAISGQYKGQGKFLSRYMLAGQEQWLIREGKAYITVDSNASQPLVITNFKLENKLNEY